MAKNKKQSKFSLRRLIYNDKYLIIVSLILAVVIWVVASINIGTDETKTIKIDAPISLGDELSDQLGMQYYTLQDEVTISVSITGAKYVIGQVTAEDLSVKFDTSAVNRTGIHNIPILVSDNSKNLDFNVTSTYPSSIEAYFDVNDIKTFNVDLNYDNDRVAEGYIFGNPVLSSEKVLVSGPQSYIDKVESIFANVHFSDEDKNLTKPFNTTSDLEVKGLGLEANYLTISSVGEDSEVIDSVKVTLPVLKKVTLPVSVDMVGAPSGVGNAVSVSYSVDNLSAGVLDSAKINRAVIGTIDFSRLAVGENKFSFDVTNLKGITVLDNVKKVDVVATVSSSMRQRTVEISNNNVTVEGIPSGYSAKVVSLDKSSVSVIAPDGVNISASDLNIKCDVSTKKDDMIYQLTITVNSNNKSWVYGTYTAKIDLIEQD